MNGTVAVENRLGHLTDYHEAWDRQREIHEEVVSGARPSTMLLVEHPPVFTAGKRTQPSDRPWDGSPVVEVDRGGRITWHGPGQIVGYPIVTLPTPVDVMDFVHRLEAAIMEVCASYGIETMRVDERTGVWVPADSKGIARKIAAIGVRVSKGVTMHGFALNANCDLSWYDRIVPCGIPDAGVTSLSKELERDVSVAEVAPLVEAAMLKHLSGWAL
ncbi:MAG: octanoyltransferase [Actinomycetota bacterium]|jgi:lipoyl(octanoyl) transferase